jgi:hypothetical protein
MSNNQKNNNNNNNNNKKNNDLQEANALQLVQPPAALDIAVLCCKACLISCQGFLATKKNPAKCGHCRCDVSQHTIRKLFEPRKRTAPAHFGATISDTAEDEKKDNVQCKHNDDDDDGQQDDEFEFSHVDKRARHARSSSNALGNGSALSCSSSTNDFETTKELVAEFAAIPAKIEAQILAPLRRAFVGRLPKLNDESLEHSYKLRSTCDNLFLLAAIGALCASSVQPLDD